MRAMELAEWCSSSRVIIVAGKGGVGKTTTAAALAVAAARAGRKVLLVELEGKSGLGSMFGVERLHGEVEVDVHATRELCSDVGRIPGPLQFGRAPGLNELLLRLAYVGLGHRHQL